MKISPVGPEIIGIQEIIFKKNLTLAEHIACDARMTRMLKNGDIIFSLPSSAKNTLTMVAKN